MGFGPWSFIKLDFCKNMRQIFVAFIMFGSFALPDYEIKWENCNTGVEEFNENVFNANIPEGMTKFLLQSIRNICANQLEIKDQI